LKTFKLLLEQFEIWNWGFNLAKGRHPKGTILCGEHYHLFKRGLPTTWISSNVCWMNKKLLLEQKLIRLNMLPFG